MDTDPIFHYTNKTVHIIDKYETHAFLDNQNVVKTQYGEQVVYSDYDQFVIGNDYNVTVDGTNSIYGLSKNMWK
jgi:hypothetical protein